MDSLDHAADACDCMCVVCPGKYRCAKPWPCPGTSLLPCFWWTRQEEQAAEVQLGCADVLQARPPQQLLDAGASYLRLDGLLWERCRTQIAMLMGPCSAQNLWQMNYLIVATDPNTNYQADHSDLAICLNVFLLQLFVSHHHHLRPAIAFQ